MELILVIWFSASRLSRTRTSTMWGNTARIFFTNVTAHCWTRSISEWQRTTRWTNRWVDFAEKHGKTYCNHRLFFKQLSFVYFHKKKLNRNSQMFITLTEKQLRAKCYEQIKEGKYVKVHQTPNALSTARENQLNRLRYFETILHGLSERCPRFRREFAQIQDMLRKRLTDQLTRPASNTNWKFS